MIEIDSIDHVVITATDVELTVDFYSRVLGMRAVTFGAGRRALVFGTQKINLHQAGAELEPKAARPTPGSADLCFITSTPLSSVVEHMEACGVEVVEGPVARTGAVGPLRSVYVRDPDGNLVEIANREQSRE
jgi:catechol 2,3-dioxygenase-like lactoylglutathione lyase family enzyme